MSMKYKQSLWSVVIVTSWIIITGIFLSCTEDYDSLDTSSRNIESSEADSNSPDAPVTDVHIVADDSLKSPSIANSNIDTAKHEWDKDGDGWFEPMDCDDNAPEVNPDAIEIPANGIDDDCDGTTD